MSSPEENLFPFARSFPLRPLGVDLAPLAAPDLWVLDHSLTLDLPPEDPPQANEAPFPLPPDPPQPTWF